MEGRSHNSSACVHSPCPRAPARVRLTRTTGSVATVEASPQSQRPTRGCYTATCPPGAPGMETHLRATPQKENRTRTPGGQVHGPTLGGHPGALLGP